MPINDTYAAVQMENGAQFKLTESAWTDREPFSI